jgi:hypothetical protein
MSGYKDTEVNFNNSVFPVRLGEQSGGENGIEFTIDGKPVKVAPSTRDYRQWQSDVHNGKTGKKPIRSNGEEITQVEYDRIQKARSANVVQPDEGQEEKPKGQGLLQSLQRLFSNRPSRQMAEPIEQEVNVNVFDSRTQANRYGGEDPTSLLGQMSQSKRPGKFVKPDFIQTIAPEDRDDLEAKRKGGLSKKEFERAEELMDGCPAYADMSWRENREKGYNIINSYRTGSGSEMYWWERANEKRANEARSRKLKKNEDQMLLQWVIENPEKMLERMLKKMRRPAIGRIGFRDNHVDENILRYQIKRQSICAESKIYGMWGMYGENIGPVLVTGGPCD